MAATIGSVIVPANYSRGMVGMFTFIILLTTLGNVIAYLFSATADVVLGLPLYAWQSWYTRRAAAHRLA